MSDQAGLSQAKREWVERVLSVKLPGAGVTGTGQSEPDIGAVRTDLSLRVKDILTQAALLPEPFRKEVIASGRAVAGLLKDDDMALAADEVDALEQAYARAAGTARIEEARKSLAGVVPYRKLQLAWRDAQGTAQRALERFMAAVLADPEVVEDELYDEVVEAAAGIDTLMPRFGGTLSDLLDRLDGTTDPEERAALTREANAVIDDYVAALDDSEGLQAMQSLSDDEYGGIAFVAPLQDALRAMQSAIG